MCLRSLPRVVRGLLGAVLLFAASHVGAQEDIAYGERVDVRVVNLDVLVLDKKGQPVFGLTRDDFNITEDGRNVDVQFFAAPAARGQDDRGWAENDFPEPAEAETAELVILLDDLNVTGPARQRFLKDLRQLLEGLEPLPPTLLVQRRRSLPVLHGPSRDLDELIAAVDDFGKPLAQGLVVSIARRRALQEIDGIIEGCLAVGQTARFGSRDLCTDCFGEILGSVNRYAITQASKVEEVASGLLGAVGAMGTGQSQRSLLYVGDGLPQIPGLPMFSYLGDLCPDRRSETQVEALRYKQERLFEEVGAIANASRVSLYFFDAGGLRPQSVDVDSVRFPPTLENDSYFNQNQQAGMNLLARDTGGRAIVNTNRALEPMQTMVQDREARYSLGFSVDRKPTGRVHDLRVFLRPGIAKGRQLRYRRSFLDLTAEGRLLQQLNAALYAGTVRESFPVELSHGDVEHLARKKRRVPVQIRIPESALTVLPGPPDGKPRGKARVALASTDDRDRLSGYRQRILELGEGGVVPTAEGHYSLVVNLDVAPGSRIFAVAVRDETTGETTLVRSTLEIP